MYLHIAATLCSIRTSAKSGFGLPNPFISQTFVQSQAGNISNQKSQKESRFTG
jgi:hypothetical protein